MLKLPWVRALFVCLCAFTVFMALNPHPPKLQIDQFGDKFEHMLAFGVLSVIARIAFPKASDWRIVERMSFGGALIEVFQAIPSLHRDCDWRDWVADTIAAAIALLIMRLVWKRPSVQDA